MLHPTYKHLEARIRLAGLSLGQWAQLFVSALAAYGVSRVLPLPGSWSLSLAVTVCGLPVAAAIAFMQAEFDVRVWVVDAVRFRRGPRLFAPGGAAIERVRVDEPGGRRAGEPAPGCGLDVDGLWDV